MGEVRVLRIKPDHIVLLHGADHIIKKIHTQEGDEDPETGDFHLDQEENKNRISESDYQKTAEQSLPLEDTRSIISFNYKTSALASEACEELDRVASLAKQSANFEIVIFGYTDNVGSPEYNEVLSKSRAKIVESYLVEKGMNPERITTVGMGEKNPLMPNTTPEGRAANRRVEIQMVPAGG